MSLENEPLRLTVAVTRRVTTQWPPLRRATRSRTWPAEAPLTWPARRAVPPRTVRRVDSAARAPRRPPPTAETRALASPEDDEDETGGAGAIGATGTELETGGSGVGVGVGAGSGGGGARTTPPSPPGGAGGGGAPARGPGAARGGR